MGFLDDQSRLPLVPYGDRAVRPHRFIEPDGVPLLVAKRSGVTLCYPSSRGGAPLTAAFRPRPLTAESSNQAESGTF